MYYFMRNYAVLSTDRVVWIHIIDFVTRPGMGPYVLWLVHLYLYPWPASTHSLSLSFPGLSFPMKRCAFHSLLRCCRTAPATLNNLIAS